MWPKHRRVKYAVCSWKSFLYCCFIRFQSGSHSHSSTVHSYPNNLHQNQCTIISLLAPIQFGRGNAWSQSIFIRFYILFAGRKKSTMSIASWAEVQPAIYFGFCYNCSFSFVESFFFRSLTNVCRAKRIPNRSTKKIYSKMQYYFFLSFIYKQHACSRSCTG